MYFCSFRERGASWRDFAFAKEMLRIIIGNDVLFTGINNFKVYTLKDEHYNRLFGFTDAEVREMLEYYGFMDKSDDSVKKEIEILINGGGVMMTALSVSHCGG